MATITQLKTPAELVLGREFEEAVGSLPGSVAVRDLRETAFATIAAKGLPHRRVEDYKYTDLKALMRDVAPLAGPTGATALAAIASSERSGIGGALRLAIVDGVFRPELSDLAQLPAGVTVTSLKAALEAGSAELIAHISGPTIAQGDPALALNAAFMSDGVVIEVAAGTKVPQVFNIVHLVTAAQPVSVHTRCCVIAGAGAEIGIVETSTATVTGHQRTSVVNVVLSDGARIEHAVIKDDATALDLATQTVVIGARARFQSFALVSAGDVTRRQHFVRFAGDHSSLTLTGASLLKGRMHADTTLVVEHDSLHCESRELFRHVIDGEAHGVFQGKVIVRPGAQKTDGKMASNALLLSDAAEMDNKPELEIYADDVACGHGATCGALDETPIFYLMSRGLSRPEAEALLIQSFVGEVVDSVGDGPLAAIGEDLRDLLTARIEAWLSGRTATGRGTP